MPRMWFSHVTHVHEAFHAHEWGVWGVSHLWFEHGYLRIRWVMSHIRIIHVTRPFWHYFAHAAQTEIGVMSHMWTSPITQVNEPYHTYEWVTSYARTNHVVIDMNLNVDTECTAHTHSIRACTFYTHIHIIEMIPNADTECRSLFNLHSDSNLYIVDVHMECFHTILDFPH